MSYVFLSYAGTESDRARQLAETLQRRGFLVCSAHDEIATGNSWAEEIELKLEAARCIVVLWSKDSLESRWVREEASYAREQGTLVSVLMDHVRPPPGFDEVQTIDLSEWDGDPISESFGRLAQAIGRILSESQVVVVPSQIVIVVGRTESHGRLGPTLNVTCSFRNELDRRVVIRKLEMTCDGPGLPARQLVWALFYETIGGGLHRKTRDGSLELELTPSSVTTMGVQFRGASPGGDDNWPTGEYRSRLIGWVDSEPAQNSANLRTDFRLSISADAAAEVRRWKEAGTDVWTRLGDPDDAVGIPVLIQDVGVSSLPSGSITHSAK